jgi:hypoxanthine-guanine phosphoribosyltransferase
MGSLQSHLDGSHPASGFLPPQRSQRTVLPKRSRFHFFAMALSQPKPALQASILLTSHRFQNSRGAFTATPKTVSNKKILLIDDVITTGATIAAGVRALLDAGAASVDIRAFAIADRYERTRRELHAFFQRREHNR